MSKRGHGGSHSFVIRVCCEQTATALSLIIFGHNQRLVPLSHSCLSAGVTITSSITHIRIGMKQTECNFMSRKTIHYERDLGFFVKLLIRVLED